MPPFFCKGLINPVTTSLNTKIDVPLILGRLVPAAEYHWKGSGYGSYADIGEWRSPGIPKPSEAAVYAEWDVYLAEQARATGRESVLHIRLSTPAESAVGVQVEQLSPAQVRALLVVLLQREGAIAADGSIKPLDTWAQIYP